ncbi:MAG: LD-carboxypeptidase, partial [Acidobacteriota bacterium]
MQEPLKPPALRPGDTIGVVAPASNLKPHLLKAGCEELERLGFRVKHKESISAQTRYTAGTVARRAEELNSMLVDPEVKAIFAARGGYGSMHLLEHLDTTVLAGGPKIVMGYSDITSLLIALYQQANWVTFHGPMVAKDFAAGPDHYDHNSFFNILTRALPAGRLDCRGTRVLSSGIAEGILLGGCLPLIMSLMGTRWELATAGAILFLEDSGSKPYQIDRWLTQLRLAGKLDNVRGIVFGEMVDCIQ